MTHGPHGRISLTTAQLAAALATVECGHAAALVDIEVARERVRYRCPSCHRDGRWEDLPSCTPSGGGNMLLRTVRREEAARSAASKRPGGGSGPAGTPPVGLASAGSR